MLVVIKRGRGGRQELGRRVFRVGVSLNQLKVRVEIR